MLIIMDELERLSSELKQFLTKYNKRIMLGHFTQLMETSSSGMAQNKLGRLSSPMRQLYYLAGLLVTTTKKWRGSKLYRRRLDLYRRTFKYH